MTDHPLARLRKAFDDDPRTDEQRALDAAIGRYAAHIAAELLKEGYRAPAVASAFLSAGVHAALREADAGATAAWLRGMADVIEALPAVGPSAGHA